MNKQAIYERIMTMLRHLQEKTQVFAMPQTDLLVQQTGYKSGSCCPQLTPENADFFGRESLWGGEADAHAWFYKRVVIPEAKEGIRYELQVRTQPDESGWDASNPQFILYFDGQPVQGLDLHHTGALLPRDRDAVEVHLYAYTGTNLQPADPLKLYVDVVGIDETCEKLWYDLKVPADVLAFTKENSREYVQILGYLNNALNLLDWRSDGLFRASCAAASDYMERTFYGDYCAKGNVQVKCIGHTHIDIGWLWTVRQTREKAQRSFFTVLELMNRYPDYKFMSSQVPLYQAIKEEAPEEYEQIKERIKEGRWEVEGAMWVEADCNLTSGESLVRQVLYGKRFFKEEFGIDSKVLWLPDVFGYAAALPQILQKSGVDKFVTSKISWNDTNTLPNDTFTWKGIDGTEIFTYFMTAQEMHRDDRVINHTTYLPQGNASYVMGAWNRYQNKELSNETILTFGYGDGGGGPTARDLEMLQRMEHGIPGCPTTKIETATEFLNRLEEQSRGKRPSWAGELYFEYHRGTYTSQAGVKKSNRKAEFALHDLELVASVAHSLFDTAYPRQELAQMWQTLLVNQFHDILPGSSIKEVYETANAQNEGIITRCKTLTQELLNTIAAKNPGEGLLVFNPTSFTTGGTVQENGMTRYVADIPANGFAVTTPEPMDGSVKVGAKRIANKYFLMEFDDSMNICRLYDKRNDREVLPQGQVSNRLVLFEDFPFEYDAWEMRSYYNEKSYPLDSVESTKSVFDGERSGLQITRRFGASSITQTVWLYEHIDRIDVDNHIDWQEKHHILKAFFPVEVNAQKATFDIQFGNYERPTHNNTSWEQAQFEVCAQKFVDLSDSGYGMALLNDCKYGHSVKDWQISLTLLKAPTYPDPDCDMGVHTFTYALYPHAEDLRHSDVYMQAYRLNDPMLCVPAQGKGRTAFCLVQTDQPNVIVDTVKPAEDSDCMTVRLYESLNRQAVTTVQFGSIVKRVRLANLLEEPIRELEVQNCAVTLPIKPFEIVTLLVETE